MHKMLQKIDPVDSQRVKKGYVELQKKILGYEIRETERDREKFFDVFFYLSGSLLNHSVEIRRDKINKTCFGARTHIHARVYPKR